MSRLLASVLCALVVFAAIAYAQSFNLRTGQWDFTMNIAGSGGRGDLSQLPANVRAQIEAELKKPLNYKSCITAEDVKNLSLGKQDDDDDEECKVTARKITATVADMTRECAGDNKRTETGHFVATSPETLRATINVVSANGPSSITLAGKWIGAVCTEGN